MAETQGGTSKLYSTQRLQTFSRVPDASERRSPPLPLYPGVQLRPGDLYAGESNSEFLTFSSFCSDCKKLLSLQFC